MADEPTYESLIQQVEALFETGNLATKEQADSLQTAVAKLLDSGRGSTLDFSDPANIGQAGH